MSHKQAQNAQVIKEDEGFVLCFLCIIEAKLWATRFV